MLEDKCKGRHFSSGFSFNLPLASLPEMLSDGHRRPNNHTHDQDEEDAADVLQVKLIHGGRGLLFGLQLGCYKFFKIGFSSL